MAKAQAVVREDGLRRLVEAALPAAQEHAQIMRQVRAALTAGDEAAAIALLREYWGLSPVTQP